MKKPLVGLLLGIGLSAVFLWPILGHFSTHLASRQDGILVAWLIDWGSRALINGQNIFHAPFFYPEPYALGYSDLFLPTALFNVFLVKLGSNNLVFNHNWHLFWGSVLIFWGQYLVGKELFKKQSLAILSGVIFAFSHLHLDYQAHLHVFLVAGLPWGVYFWLKFWRTQKQIYLLGLTVAGLYQFLNSPMSGYFFLIVVGCFAFSPTYFNIFRQTWKSTLPWIVGSMILIAFFYLPYWHLTNTYHVVRSIRDTAHFAFGLEKFLEPELLFWLVVTPSLLLSVKKNKPVPWLFLIITFVGGVLMLGPALKFHGQTLKVGEWPLPLPYAIAYYVVPGIKAFRATSRFVIVLGYGLALLIPQLLLDNRWRTKLKSHQSAFDWLVVLILTGLIWWWRLPNQKIYPIPLTVPPIYEVIKNQPESVLAEFPTYVWSQTDGYFHEADRLLYQAYHQKKLYNGFSGFAPPELEQRWHTISQNLTSADTINHLKQSRVQLVLLHGQEGDYQKFSHVSYELITCLDQDCLYRLK